MLLFSVTTSAFADSTNIYFNFIPSGTEEIKLNIPALGSPLKEDIDTDGFVLGAEFKEDILLFCIEYTSLSYEGGSDASCLDLMCGFEFYENAFFTIEYLSASSDTEIDYSGILFGIKGSASLDEQFYLEGNIAMNLLIDGSMSIFGYDLSGDTDIMKYGIKLGYKATEDIAFELGYKVQDMSYCSAPRCQDTDLKK